MSNELVIKVSGDIKDFTSKLDDIKKKTQDLTDGLTTMGVNAGAAFAGLTAVIGLTIGEYAKQEQAELRTAAVIKSTGEAAGVSARAVFDLAESFQNTTTYADETVIAAENMLLTFKNIGANVFPKATEAVLDMATAMGQDLTSTAIQVGKALQDPIQGVNALRRVGVQLNEAQKDNIKAFVETNNLAGAQNIILKELQSEFGGAAKAAANGTGQFLQLKNQLGEVAEVIGKDLFESLSGVTKELKDFFQTISQDKELLKSIATFIKYSAVLTGIATAIAGVGFAAIGLNSIILALDAQFLAGAIAASAFWTALGGPIGIIIAGLVATGVAAAALFEKLKQPAKEKSLQELNERLAKIKQEIIDTAKNTSGAAIDRRKYLTQEIAQLEELRQAKIKAGEIDPTKGTGLGVLKSLEGKSGPLNADGLGEKIDVPLLSAQGIENAKIEEQNKADIKIKANKDAADKIEKQRVKDAAELKKQLIDAGKTEIQTIEDTHERRIKLAKGNKELLLLIDRDFHEKENELFKKNLDKQTAIEELELAQRKEIRETTLGNVGQTLSAVAAGAGGARGVLSTGIGAGIGSLAGSPALGQAIQPLIGALMQGGEATRAFVKSFTDAVPDLIQALVEATPIFIEELANQTPVIIERLANKAPDIIAALAHEMPKVANAFLRALVEGIADAAKDIANKLNPFNTSESGGSLTSGGFGTSGIARVGLGVSTGGLSEVIPAIGNLLGFAEGGQPILKVPSGFANDKFPARLSSGEFVVNNDLTGKMEKFFNDNKNNQVSNLLLNEILNTLKTPMSVNSSVNLNTRTFADIILELSRTNQRTA